MTLCHTLPCAAIPTTERAQKLAKQRALAFTDRGERGRNGFGDDEDEEVDLLLIEVCEAMLGDDKRGLLAASANLTLTLLGTEHKP